MARKYLMGQSIPDPISQGIQALQGGFRDLAQGRERQLERALREKQLAMEKEKQEAQFGAIPLTEAVIERFGEEVFPYQRQGFNASEAAYDDNLPSTDVKAPTIPRIDYEEMLAAKKAREEIKRKREELESNITRGQELQKTLPAGTDVTLPGVSIKSPTPKSAYEIELDRRAKEARTAESEARTKKLSAEGSAGGVPGMEYYGEFSPTQDDLKKVKVAKSAHDTLQKSINKMVEKVDKYGFEVLPGGAKADISSAYADLQIKLKEAAQLGAITGPDMGIILGMAPDPTSPRTAASMLSDKKNYINLLNDLKSRTNENFTASAGAYGFRPTTGERKRESDAAGSELPPVAEGRKFAREALEGNPKNRIEIRKRFKELYGEEL